MAVAAAGPSAFDAKVRVSFTTKLDDYRIPDAGMLLPASLKRYGLSEVVNHILGRGGKRTVVLGVETAAFSPGSPFRRNPGSFRLSHRRTVPENLGSGVFNIDRDVSGEKEPPTSPLCGV